jgi:hypothetical protein
MLSLQNRIEPKRAKVFPFDARVQALAKKIDSLRDHAIDRQSSQAPNLHDKLPRSTQQLVQSHAHLALGLPPPA